MSFCGLMAYTLAIKKTITNWRYWLQWSYTGTKPETYTTENLLFFQDIANLLDPFSEYPYKYMTYTMQMSSKDQNGQVVGQTK